MRFDTLFLRYLGITTLVYPYLVVLFNFSSATYVHFSLLLLSFFLGGVAGTLLPVSTDVIRRYAGLIAMCSGGILVLYPLQSEHAVLFLLQFLFGVTNSALRMIEKEQHSILYQNFDSRRVVRSQFWFMILGTLAGGIVGYFFDIAVVIIGAGVLLFSVGIGYTYQTRTHA